MQFKLVIQDDEGKTTTVALSRDEITIGRKEGNTIRLTERNVSRRHARILRNNGEVHIEDLGSYNGIRVNNARIAERVSLRVSDQVQIGDYKLYLKSEAYEADPARTVPIDRVDSQHPAPQLPTEVIPSVALGSPAPHAMVPQIASGSNRPPGAAPDPAIHQIGPATAPATAPRGYGKLVVLSSNFAGKEFDLSRPQMIIGRTDENDIVVNHRSISRNHAKLVRDPETGRYTISDLQSSNGVRVNGQDYGKVELRRGDVVDLGHVRLRFVEPNEDFVFARDAVVTDVPETGRGGMMIALLAAIVIVGAGIVVYVMRNPSGDATAISSKGTNSDALFDAGDVVAVGSDPPGPDIVNDATARTNLAGKPDDQTAQQSKLCTELQATQNWQGLTDCAKALEALGARDKAKEFQAKAVKEQKNELTSKKVGSAFRDRNLKQAEAWLTEIGDGSVYYKNLHDQFLKEEGLAVDAATRKAQSYASAHDCAGLRQHYRQVVASSTSRVAAEVQAVRCTEKVPPPDSSGRHSSGTGKGSATSTVPPPPKGPCETMNVDELVAQAAGQFSAGYAKPALSLISKALTCKQDIRMYRLAGLYACAAHDLNSAKLYYAKVPAQFQAGIEQKCQQEGLNLRGP
jgi:pSer/pThr/pTyr-binding forkhead associated (FHA) protein